MEDPKFLENFNEKFVSTIYGDPSSPIVCGNLKGMEVCVLSRHGKKHEIPPSQVNYRANIWALKSLGCTHIIATTAVGSLKEEIKPGDFVILDQLIDFTKQRKITFYEKFENGPMHSQMAEPFSGFLREKIIQCCLQENISFHEKGTVITIEGPRFSTKAESNLFRQWGADVINMSIAPEAALCREAGIEYAAIAMSTDYDCWKENETPVSWDQVLKIFTGNSEKMRNLLVNIIENLPPTDEDFLKSKIRAINDFPKQGIVFRDITTLLKDKDGFEKMIDIFFERYKDKNIELICGIESRGFIIGSALSYKLGVGFVPIRKKGKLPAETIKQEYDLEYGSDVIEIHKDAILPGQKVLLIDDLIATGGTAVAAADLIEKIGGVIEECAFVIELVDLKGGEKLRGRKFFSAVKY